MRDFLLSLRTQILLNLLIMMLATVALLGTLMFKMAERDILEERVKSGKAVVSSLARVVGPHLADQDDLRRLVGPFPLDGLTIVGEKGTHVFAGTSSLRESDQSRAGAEKALASGRAVVDIGKSLMVSEPLIREGRTIGAISATFPLNDVRSRIGRSQRLVLVYLALDAVVLTLLGSWLFSRAISKPIGRLVEATE